MSAGNVFCISVYRAIIPYISLREAAERSEDGEGKQPCRKTLSVTCGDSSPKGRAKGLLPVKKWIVKKWIVSVSVRSIDCFMNTHLPGGDLLFP